MAKTDFTQSDKRTALVEQALLYDKFLRKNMYAHYLKIMLGQGLKISSDMIGSDMDYRPIWVLEASNGKQSIAKVESLIRKDIHRSLIFYRSSQVEIKGDLWKLTFSYDVDKGKLSKHGDYKLKFDVKSLQEIFPVASKSPDKKFPNVVKNFFDGDLFDFSICVEKIFPLAQALEEFVEVQMDALCKEMKPKQLEDIVTKFRADLESSEEPMPLSYHFRSQLLFGLERRIKTLKKLEREITNWSP
tara:strand:+ start:561 stop:1295 length:735 start_codon:yes stop_codon:yes gene_type:complete